MNKKVLGVVSALALGAVGTGACLSLPAHARPSRTETAAVSARQTAQGGRGRRTRRIRRALGRRVGIHGQATVRTKKGFVQVVWQRGVLTSTSGGTLTVRSLDGTIWQWRTDGTTRFRKSGRRTDLSGLAVNDFVATTGQTDGGGDRTAKRVNISTRVPAGATPSPSPASAPK